MLGASVRTFKFAILTLGNSSEENYIHMALSEKGISFQGPSINFFARDVVRVVNIYTELLGFIETFRTPLDKIAFHLAYFLEKLYIAFAQRELIDYGSA